jgi:hypothetical protein
MSRCTVRSLIAAVKSAVNNGKRKMKQARGGVGFGKEREAQLQISAAQVLSLLALLAQKYKY